VKDQGHILWNAGKTVADYLEENADKYVKDKNVLEFGAGAGLPSIVAAINGATCSVATDYPDEELIINLKYNFEHCSLLENANIHAQVCYLCHCLMR
jgi:EEF1A N-terminal glycine/lysine methyltransferase